MKNKSSLLIKVSFMLLVFYAVFICGIFIPAGTVQYKAGWLYFATFFTWTNILTFYFLAKEPALIERRTQTEKEKPQQLIQLVNGLMFMAMLIIPGFDFKYGLSKEPFVLNIIATVLVSFGFLIVFFVFKQNSFLASNVKAYASQTVISTGLYGLVRHPMYTGAYFIILFTPLALGSYLALIPALIIAIFIVFRTLNEEQVLARDLQGYRQYCEKVKYRYLPGIW